MKAIVFEKIGGPLVEKNIPKPVPSDDEVLIEVHAASVNPADHKMREGLYAGNLNLELPHVSGRDFSGVISERGKNVSSISVGDEVFGVLDTGREGTYAEFVTEKVSLIAPKPDFLSHAEASALALTGLTAIVSLIDTGNLKQSEKILIQGGAGGVGSYAIQLAKHLGAEVITTASARNHEYLKKLGADQIIDYNLVDFRKVVSDCDIVFDTVGGEVHRNSYEVLKPTGRMVYVAPQPKDFNIPKGDITILRPQVGRARTYLDKIINFAKIKAVVAPEIETFLLSQASDAQEKSKTKHVRGKIVLLVR